MKKAAGISAVKSESGWAERLLEAFAITLGDPARNDFLHILDEMLRQVGANNGDVMQWRRLLFGLHSHVFASLASEADRSNVEKLLQQSQLLVGEIAQWAQAHLRLQTERRLFNFAIGISEPLMTAFDVAGLTEVMARQLPQVGIGTCYLSLYEQAGEKEHTDRIFPVDFGV